MLSLHLSKRAGLPRGRARLIWIISIIVGATVIAITILVTFLLVRHRRRRGNRHFKEACLRDPGLTWEEYERRGRLTRSRLLFEEEIQRSNMIRKSQQSRTSDRKEGDFSAVSSEQELAQMPRSPSRSKSWHGRSRSALAAPVSALNDDVEAGGEHGDGVVLAREVVADWNSVHASVEQTWQILHGRKLPTLASRAAATGQWWNDNHNNDNNSSSSNNQDDPSRLPTVRLKTPPLLSHPIFRDGNTQHQSRHMSLPTELTRSKTEPRSGLGRKEEDVKP